MIKQNNSSSLGWQPASLRRTGAAQQCFSQLQASFLTPLTSRDSWQKLLSCDAFLLLLLHSVRAERAERGERREGAKGNEVTKKRKFGVRNKRRRDYHALIPITHKRSKSARTHSWRRKSVSTDRCLLAALHTTTKHSSVTHTVKYYIMNTPLYFASGLVFSSVLVSSKVPSKVCPLMRSCGLSGEFYQSAFIDFDLKKKKP